MKDFLKLLKNPNYLLLWLGQSVSDLGSSINYIGLIWYVMELSGAASGVGGLFIALTLPSILVGPWAGVLVDRFNKKAIIVATDVIRGLIALAMVMTTDITTIYFLVILNGIAQVFFSPAINVAIPRIVDGKDLMTANSLFSTTSSAATLIGPAIGGVLIALHGAKALFLINGISFLMSAFSELWITIPKQEVSKAKEEKSSMVSEMKLGLEYINKHEIVKFVIIFFAVSMLALGGLPILNIILVKEVFQFSAETFGLLMSFSGVGFLVASFCMGKWGKKFSELKLIIAGVAVYGLLYALLAFQQNILLISLMFFFVGFAIVVVDIAYGTYLQVAVEDKMRGRVFSIDIALGNVAALISIALVGVMSDVFGVRTTLVVIGLALCVHAIVATRLGGYNRGNGLLKRIRVNNAVKEK
ncbi:MFS transporter [bacterium AH-315-K05]|nr:MFS transporter [bacterium AH-315-K05]MBN4074690.1 MFS transporter [bacterium AH-315-E09]